MFKMNLVVTKPKVSNRPMLAVFALLFTVALTFATIELPLILNRYLHEKLDVFFYDWTIALEFHKKLERIGYVVLVVVLLLILVGFLTGRRRMSTLGSIAFFLPTFAYFAGGMFILAGLGLLRSMWSPFYSTRLEVLLYLGDIIYLPYLALNYPFSLIGVDIGISLAYLAIGTGLFIFFSRHISMVLWQNRKQNSV